MHPRPSALLACAALGIAALAPATARAEPPTAADRARAGARFEEGVKLFNRAEFAEAARAFLDADRLAPSAIAVTNAIAAARRANDHLLVARTAERAIARGDAVVEARAALAEAATRLARLEIACDVSPCAVSVDGDAVSGAAAWALPGTLRVEARGAAGATAEERVVTMAGATYKIALHPAAKPVAPPPVKPPPPEPKGLPRPVFFAGVGMTLVLAGVTAWSGADAIAAKHALPASPYQGELDDVRQRARRTDYLLLGTGLAAIGTAVIGVWFTSFRGRAAAGVQPVPGGAVIAASGRLP